MKKKVLAVLVAVNVILAVLLTMGPIAAQVFPKSLKKDCCVGDNCVANYCWIVNDCDNPGGSCIN